MKKTSGELGKFFDITRIDSALPRTQEKNVTPQICSTNTEPRNTSALSLKSPCKQQNSLGYNYSSVKIQLKQAPNDVDVKSEVKLALCIIQSYND